MSVELSPAGALIFGVMGAILAANLGLPAEPWGIAVMVVFGFFGVVAWYYSPLPNRTAGPMVSQTGAGYWGFRRSNDND